MLTEFTNYNDSDIKVPQKTSGRTKIDKAGKESPSAAASNAELQSMDDGSDYDNEDEYNLEHDDDHSSPQFKRNQQKKNEQMQDQFLNNLSLK